MIANNFLPGRGGMRGRHSVTIAATAMLWLTGLPTASAGQQQTPPPPPADTLARAVYDLGYEPGLNVLRQGQPPVGANAGQLLRIAAGTPGDDTVVLTRGIASALTAAAPVAAGAFGFSFDFDERTGSFSRRSATFGSFAAEPAQTLGRGRATFGVSFQRLSFARWNGTDLDSGIQIDASSTGEFERETRTVTTRAKTRLDLDATRVSLLAVFGITDRLDASIVVPFSSVELTGTSESSLCNPDCNVALPLVSRSSASTGFDDMLIRAKYFIGGSHRASLATAVETRLPTGDPNQFQGTGSLEVRPYVLWTIAARNTSVHFDVGYLIAERPTNADPFAAFQSAEGWQFKIGGAVAMTPRLSISGDIIRRAVRGVGLDSDERTGDASVTLGGKIAAASNLLLSFGTTIPVTSTGIVPKIAPIVGVEFVF